MISVQRTKISREAQNNSKVSFGPETLQNGCLNKSVQVCRANMFSFIFISCGMLQEQERPFQGCCWQPLIQGVNWQQSGFSFIGWIQVSTLQISIFNLKTHAVQSHLSSLFFSNRLDTETTGH